MFHTRGSIVALVVDVVDAFYCYCSLCRCHRCRCRCCCNGDCGLCTTFFSYGSHFLSLHWILPSDPLLSYDILCTYTLVTIAKTSIKNGCAIQFTRNASQPHLNDRNANIFIPTRTWPIFVRLIFFCYLLFVCCCCCFARYNPKAQSADSHIIIDIAN